MEINKLGQMIIPDQEKVEKLIAEFVNDGVDKLHFLLDYDGTVTHERDEKGQIRPSLISVLRNGNYLSGTYAGQATALAEHYKPLEKSPDLSLEERKSLMHQWWSRHYDLLAKCGLNLRDVEKAMEESGVKIRQGMRELLELAKAKGVPVIIMSASGLGTDAIKWHLKKNGLLLDNIEVISNQLEWDAEGKLIGCREPIIHSLNKDESSVKQLPVFEKISGRKNIILMGDGLGDLGMAKGLEGAKVLPVGFYNEYDPAKLAVFEQNFDIVVTDDADGSELHSLLKAVFEQA